MIQLSKSSKLKSPDANFLKRLEQFKKSLLLMDRIEVKQIEAMTIYYRIMAKVAKYIGMITRLEPPWIPENTAKDVNGIFRKGNNETSER